MYLPSILVTAFLAITPTLAIPTSLVERQTSCASGLYIIVARASTESPGEGIIGSVADDVIRRVPGSRAVAVDYPATLQNYENSKNQGVTAMTRLITTYAQSCPNGKIALMGYSQGAQVIADTLIGSPTGGGSGINTQYTKNFVAAIQMGDPSFVSRQSFDVGTSTQNGIFRRSNAQSYTTKGYAGLIQSFCDSGDTYCASGNSLQVHLSYVRKYGDQAANFVVGKAA